MRTEFKTKKSISFALGILTSFLFMGTAFGWEITITSDSWDFMCPVQDANGLIAPEAPWQGEIPRQTNCNACRGMSDSPRVFYDGSGEFYDVSRGFSDVSRGFLMCRTALLCNCPDEHTYQ